MSSSMATRLHGIFTKTPKQLSSFPLPSNSTPKEPPIFLPQEINQLVKQFLQNSAAPNFRRRKHHYKGVVRRLAAGNHFSAIETILEHQKNYKSNMSDEGFVVRLMMLYGQSNMFDHAYKLFDEMPQFNCRRTVISFNALLSICAKSKSLDKISEIFEDVMGKLGIKPNVVSYNIVIKAYCEANDFDSARKVLEKMEESDVCPDSVSYHTIFEGYLKGNELVEAEKLWERMEEKGVIGNVRSYNANLRSLIGNGWVEEALEMLGKMGDEEVKPDKFSYNAVIKGCVGSGKLDEAKMLHGKMAGKGCFPDHATYEMLIPFAHDKGDIGFAFELCKQAVELKVSVSRSLMQLVVDGLIEKSMIEEANELVALVNSSKRHRYTLICPATVK